MKDPASFRATFNAALAAGEPWVDRQRADDARVAAEALDLARDLLDDPMILDRAETFMREAGYAGDVAVPLLVFVALVSRLLERPMNLAVVAQSAAGKNRAVDAALGMMPADAVYIVKAGSPRALIYTSADFEHRTVVVGEADSIPEEGRQQPLSGISPRTTPWPTMSSSAIRRPAGSRRGTSKSRGRPG